jgi:hypothetical protein
VDGDDAQGDMRLAVERLPEAEVGRVDLMRVVCAAVWERVDAAPDGEAREQIVAAGERALRPWTTELQLAG